MQGTSATARLLTLVFFLLLVGICAYWTLQIIAPRPAIAPSGSIGDDAAAPNLAPSALLFGSVNATAAAAPSAPTNIQVIGVAEAGPSGVVLLAVDGKPAAPYGVNDTVTEGTTVKTVALDRITLDQRGRLIELKAPDRASMSILSSGADRGRSSDRATAPPVATRAPLPTVPAPAPSAPTAPAPAAAAPDAPQGARQALGPAPAVAPSQASAGVQPPPQSARGQNAALPAFPPPQTAMPAPGQFAQPPGQPVVR